MQNNKPNPLYPTPQDKAYQLTTASTIYTISNCANKGHAIDKMIVTFPGFKESDIINITRLN